ncbi:hypothetical protein MKK64_16820 [Methylobacterium sp. E-025]|uniref:hypothetical protein n=1 Tax=Methylobacterium sp. E-025 TaxID=2836561 RepID=UPI001FB88167|nr:hypothetical protein [Methylobacterium sp. E-025]MCJ2112848.1 hypothetical protein [Methylobacterium sp. E-025]
MPLNPERDECGEVVPHDDPELRPETFLIRNINPEYHLVPDENTGGQRIGSSAFSATNGDPTYGMSADLSQIIDEAGASLLVNVPNGFGAVLIPVSRVRGLGLPVGSDPVHNNKYHGQIWGVKKPKRTKIHSVVEKWLVPLPGIAIR